MTTKGKKAKGSGSLTMRSIFRCMMEDQCPCWAYTNVPATEDSQATGTKHSKIVS